LTWKIQRGSDFKSQYKNHVDQQELFDFAIALILESNDPRTLPLTITCPNDINKCMVNLQNTHAIIIRIHTDSNEIEFIFCN